MYYNQKGGEEMAKRKKLKRKKKKFRKNIIEISFGIISGTVSGILTALILKALGI